MILKEVMTAACPFKLRAVVRVKICLAAQMVGVQCPRDFRFRLRLALEALTPGVSFVHTVRQEPPRDI